MTEGTLNLMQSIWKLVGSVVENNGELTTNTNKTIKEIKKFDDELVKIRNTSISMVIDVFVLIFKRLINLKVSIYCYSLHII
jgi:hypothetical protein